MKQNGQDVSWQMQAVMAGVILGSVPVVLAIGGWLADRLSPDALGMAVGLIFGVLAGVPTALLVMAANSGRVAMDDCGDDEFSPPSAAPAVVHNRYHVHLHGGAELPVRNGERPAALVVPESRRLEVC